MQVSEACVARRLFVCFYFNTFITEDLFLIFAEFFYNLILLLQSSS